MYAYLWRTKRTLFHSFSLLFQIMFFKSLTKESYSILYNTYTSTSLQFFNIIDKGENKYCKWNNDLIFR